MYFYILNKPTRAKEILKEYINKNHQKTLKIKFFILTLTLELFIFSQLKKYMHVRAWGIGALGHWGIGALGHWGIENAGIKNNNALHFLLQKNHYFYDKQQDPVESQNGDAKMPETSYSDSFFKSSNLRECRFFFNRLKTENIAIKIFDGSQENNEKLVFRYDEDRAINIQKIINDSIYFKFKNLDDIDYFIHETRHDMKVYLINKDLIKTLFTDERSLFYSWVYIEVISQLKEKAYNSIGLAEMDYSHFGSGVLGSSRNNMTNSIMYIIDSMKCKKIEKEMLIYRIREKYISEAASFGNMFSWAKKSDKNEHKRIFKSLIKEIEKTKFDLEWNYTCVNACQKVFVHSSYLGVHILFLIWIADHSKKELFIKRAYKSWSQKTYRENIESKKKITISLSENSLNYLNSIKNNNKKSYEKIINELIENAYSLISHKNER